MAKISFIGGGVMAEAIISRVLSENLIDANNIYVGETYEQVRSNLEKKYLVRTTTNNIEAIEDSQLPISGHTTYHTRRYFPLS